MKAQRKKETKVCPVEYYELGKAHSKIEEKTVLKHPSQSTASFSVLVSKPTTGW